MDVAACRLDPHVGVRLLNAEVAGGGLQLGGSELAASLDVAGLRADVEIGAVRAHDAEDDVGPAAERHPEAVAQPHFDDDLLSSPASDQLDARRLDQFADRIAVRKRLELDVRLVGGRGLDLDPPRRDLEVEAGWARWGEGQAA